MKEIIKGIVKGNPIELERCCLYTMEQNGDAYLIFSTGRQALKDSIFVAEDQEIAVKGVLLAEKVRINTNCFLQMEEH